MNSKEVGEISEAQVLARLVKLGFPVLLPFGNNQKYDLVYEDSGKLIKAQVKTGRFRNGAVEFNVCSVNGFNGQRTTYETSVDVFLVYCPALDKVYRVPVSLCGKSVATLRVEQPKGGPKTTINWAEEYIL